jgi:hypothetical protein
MEVLMKDKTEDPFVDALTKWKWRVEQLAFFLFLVLHLLLIEIVGVTLLIQHIQKVTGDWQAAPAPAKVKESSAH